MNVNLVIDKELNKDNLIIKCNSINKEVLKIKDFAEKFSTRIIGKDKNEKRFISHEDIYYIESIEKKTFVYLMDEIWECELKLYEIEELLKGLSFLRISKSCIANIRKVEKVSVMVNRNLMLTMDNNESIVMSRRYVKSFKEFIGMEV